MSFGKVCRVRSSQCIIWEIAEFLLNTFACFFVQPLFCALNYEYIVVSSSGLMSIFQLLRSNEYQLDIDPYGCTLFSRALGLPKYVQRLGPTYNAFQCK